MYLWISESQTERISSLQFHFSIPNNYLSIPYKFKGTTSCRNFLFFLKFGKQTRNWVVCKYYNRNFQEHFQWLQAVVRFVVFVESVVCLIILIWLKQFILIMKYCKQRVSRLRTQTYFRLSLVSDENNVCEPKPGNDLCDVTTFVSLWPIRFHDGMKLECSLQRIPRAVVLGLLELNCLVGLKFLLHRNRFWLEFAKVIFGREKRQPEIRLLSRANKESLERFFLWTCRLHAISCKTLKSNRGERGKVR